MRVSTSRRQLTGARARQRLQDAVVAAITHELRSPLGAVVMAAATLDRIPHASRPPQVDAQLASILVRASRQMRDTLDQVVALQRAASGQSELSAGSFTLAPALESVLDDIHEAERERVDLAMPTEEVGVRGDRAAFEIVVRNLINNGLRHGRDMPVEVRYDGSHGAAVIAVRDRGDGFADVASAAKPWQQGAKGPRGGFGLGLFIAHTLVEAMGGELHLSNPPQGGAEAAISLWRSA